MIAGLQKAFLELHDAGLDEDSCLDLYLNTIDDKPIPLDLTDLEKRLGDEFLKAFNLCLQSGMETADIIDKCFDALAARSVTGMLVIDYSDEASNRRAWAIRKVAKESRCGT